MPTAMETETLQNDITSGPQGITVCFTLKKRCGHWSVIWHHQTPPEFLAALDTFQKISSVLIVQKSRVDSGSHGSFLVSLS